jgi:hypothetical protein
MGSTGHLTRDLLVTEGIIDPAQFVGIDLSDDLAGRYAEMGLLVLRGDLLGLLARPELEDVGVLNLDAYYAVNSPKLLADLRLTRSMASRAVEKFGEFCLFLNADLDAAVRHQCRASRAMRQHATTVSGTYDGCGRCRIPPELLLPDGCDEAIDAGELGIFGMFEIYRGRRSGHRMANLRVVIA